MRQTSWPPLFPSHSVKETAVCVAVDVSPLLSFHVTCGYNLLENDLLEVTGIQRTNINFLKALASSEGLGRWFSSVMNMNNNRSKVAVTFLCGFHYFLIFMLTCF